jgi:hypothetical protein
LSTARLAFGRRKDQSPSHDRTAAHSQEGLQVAIDQYKDAKRGAWFLEKWSDVPLTSTAFFHHPDKNRINGKLGNILK